jgi:hypothetical protein
VIKKKYRSGKIKLPVFEYSWSKEINKKDPDMEIIQNQIDTYMFVIKNKENFNFDDYRDEFKKFTKSLIRKGHISKLDNNYQTKFLQITKFIKLFWKNYD